MMVSEGIIDYNSLEDFKIQFHLLLHIQAPSSSLTGLCIVRKR